MTAARVSYPQLEAIVSFMEKHPDLAKNHLRNTEGRHASKVLWTQLTHTVNALKGPQRSPKGWSKYWADKKSNIKRHLLENGHTTSGLSDIDRKICQVAGIVARKSSKVKAERRDDGSESVEDEASMLGPSDAADASLEFEMPPVVDADERQIAIMEKLIQVMSQQAAALSQLAQASQSQAHAFEKIADATHAQARAIERISSSFEAMSAMAHSVGASLHNIDTTMLRYYNANPT